MSMFFRNWLDKGYYEEDSWGELTRLDNVADIQAAASKGTLFEHDGMGMTKVYNLTIISNYKDTPPTED